MNSAIVGRGSILTAQNSKVTFASDGQLPIGNRRPGTKRSEIGNAHFEAGVGTQDIRAFLTFIYFIARLREGNKIQIVDTCYGADVLIKISINSYGVYLYAWNAPTGNRTSS